MLDAWGAGVSDERWRDFTVDAGGYTLAVRDYGGEGRPLILIHGNVLNVCLWDVVAPTLAEQFHVVAFDVNGYGLSEFSGTWTDQFRDIERIASALDLERPIPVGHSMGALMATDHAAHVPDCPAMIAVDAAHLPVEASRDPWDDPMLRRYAFWRFVSTFPSESPVGIWGGTQDWAGLPFRPVTEEELEEHIRFIRKQTEIESRFWNMSIESIEAFIRMIRRFRSKGPDGLLHFAVPSFYQTDSYWEGMIERILKGELPTVAIYDEISCPTLLVCATRGPYAGLRSTIDELAERHSNVRTEWLECGHNVPLEKPDALATLILDFVPAYAH